MTWSEKWPDDEIRRRIQDWYGDPDAPLAPSPTSRAADREWDRAEQFARDVIAERRRLDEFEPDWDLELNKIRASIGWDEL